MRIRTLIITFAMALVAAAGARAADPAEGQAIAQRWCASCHLVSPEQERAMDGVPSFQAIAARGDLTGETLEAFLTDPHPVMPDMALTREEIADLTAYIDGLAE
ncbi:cytochrome c [Salinarimonas sp.]|uniref:c-type cytochrome n=1 Tax=Salinarimonas sp. TaxID=2766526 RepID=UPI0032D9A680